MVLSGRGRWTSAWSVSLLGLGLMATSAVAGPRGGEAAEPRPASSFVVQAERVTLSRTPRQEGLDPAAVMLFRDEVCETSEPGRKVPWWSCRVLGTTVSGYAPRASFRQNTGEQEARPASHKSLDEWLALAWPEKEPKRHDALLIEGVLEAFRLNAGLCLGEGPASDCENAIAQRLMLHWTAHVKASPSPPARPGKELACPAGETLEACLERSLGPGTLGTGARMRPGRSTFVYVLQQPPRAVRFVTGEFLSTPGAGQEEQPAYSFELHADESREDPLLLEVLRTTSTGTVRFGLGDVLEADRYVQNVRGSRTFVTNRPLDKGFFAVCGDETRKIEKPKLVHVGVGLGEFARVLHPEYHYALPCEASFVLDESIPGIRIGKRGPVRTCRAQKKGGDESFTFHVDPVTGDCRVGLRKVRRSSRVDFSGDLNGDGRPDIVFFLVGEMGCGGPRLYLSSPEGWIQAGSSDHYC